MSVAPAKGSRRAAAKARKKVAVTKGPGARAPEAVAKGPGAVARAQEAMANLKKTQVVLEALDQAVHR